MRHMRRDLHVLSRFNEPGRIVALVCPRGNLTFGVNLANIDRHGFGCFARSVVVGTRHHGVEDQPIAVLHQRVVHEAQFAGRLALAVQPAGPVCLVAAGLASNVTTIFVVLAVFANEALVPRPGLNQGVVHAEVVLGQPTGCQHHARLAVLRPNVVGYR